MYAKSEEIFINTRRGSYKIIKKFVYRLFVSSANEENVGGVILLSKNFVLSSVMYMYGNIKKNYTVCRMNLSLIVGLYSVIFSSKLKNCLGHIWATFA